MKTMNFWVLASCFAIISGCATGPNAQGGEVITSDLNYCQTNPELLVSNEPGTTRSDLKIQYCNHIPSGGDLQIIIVEVRGEKFVYSLPTPIAVKVYSEYRFQKNGDLLLMSYGGDSPDDEGNLFDYDLYKIGTSHVLKSGRSKRRPRLLDVL